MLNFLLVLFQILLYSCKGERLHKLMDENLNTVCSVCAFHPTQQVVFGGNSSGRVHAFMWWDCSDIWQGMCTAHRIVRYHQLLLGSKAEDKLWWKVVCIRFCFHLKNCALLHGNFFMLLCELSLIHCNSFLMLITKANVITAILLVHWTFCSKISLSLQNDY
jgi:hypothetical protein